METTIYIARHGQTEWNIAGRIQGWLDSPLTDRGIQQAKELAQKMAPLTIDKIYTSSSRRAWQTAKHLRGEREVELIETDALREIGLGNWEGRTWAEIEEEFPDELQQMTDHPEKYEAQESGGETFFQAQDRLTGFVGELRHVHAGEKILLVSHALAIKVIINYFRGNTMESLWEGPDSHWASLYQLCFTDDSVRILFEGEVIVE